MSDEHPTDRLYGEDAEVAALLEGARPTPANRFQGMLARQLADQDPGWGPRPEQLWPQALGLIALGAVLLLIGVLIGT